MSIVKCEGPLGEEGYQAVTPGQPDGECHLLDPDLHPQQARAAALRAAMRDANMVASKGDPRMARDG